MCGIAGFVMSRPPRNPSKVITEMLRAIAHRGPDDEGRFSSKGRRLPKVVLGNTRLAIIDLEGGKQPVFSENEDVVAVFNGEIYNYKELRRDLESRGHRFSSGSDSEVIPHLYEEHGSEFVRMLRGMFAIALHDGSRLLLARDRFGIKPLYYAELPEGGICFGSEPSALAPLVSLEAEPALLPTYLSLGYLPAPLTPYKNVRKLPAGTLLEYENERCLTLQWWEPSAYFEVKKVSTPDLVEALEDSVTAHTVADVPIGVFISGGLDSSVVAALAARRAHQKIVAFTVGFTAPCAGEGYDFDERAEAASVARHLGLEHITLETGLPEADDLLDLAAKYGEPIGDEAAVPTYAIARVARQHVKVVLTGEGGDELFGGYDKYRAFHLLRPLMAAPPAIQRAARRVLPHMLGQRRASKISAILDEDLVAAGWKYDEIATGPERHQLLSPELRSWPVATPQLWPSLSERRCQGDFDPQWLRATGDGLEERYLLTPEELAALMASDMCGYLADGLLHKVDSATMAHGLEARVPYLDHCLFEKVGGAGALAAISAIDLLRSAMAPASSKPMLRAVAAEVLPRKIASRKKQGFSVPLEQWVARLVRSETGRALTDPRRLEQQGYWNVPKVVEVLERFRHLAEGSATRAMSSHVSRKAWAILAYQLWLETILRSS